MNYVNWFKKLQLSEKVSLVSFLSGVPVVVSFISNTDTAQKAYIKYRLLNLKFHRPRHMDTVWQAALALSYSIIIYYSINFLILIVALFIDEFN